MTKRSTYSARHYATNKERVLEQCRRRRAAMAKRLDALKAVPCTDCGVQYPPWVMDFDHVDGGKLAGISNMLTNSVRTVLEEVAKCEVVCSNCHRQRTHERNQPA